MIYQIRKRTEPEDIAYSLYLYFLGLSLRNTSKAVSRFVLESEDAETDRILGVKDKPDDPSIKDYQVLYESPKCIKHKEQYSSGEWLIGKKPVEYEV